MMQANPFSDLIPAERRTAPQPLIPRTPSPVRPVEQQIDEQRLRALELANANAATVNAQGLTPEAIHLQAQQYILNGQLPPLGMGRAAASARQAIINEAARLAGVSGSSGADLATGFARFRNSQHTLQTLDNQLGTIRGNEATALANAQQFLDRIHELYPPGSTRLGNMVRHGINEFLNDPTQAAYNAAYTTFLTEYAKVVAGSPSGSGVLSDSARREAMDMLSNATSPEAAERAVNQMRQDMANRVGALQGNIERGYGNLSQGRPASFAPNGDMLDNHGTVVPVAASSGGRGDNDTPPIMGAPPGSGPHGPGGVPPVGPAPGEHMDATTSRDMGPSGDAVSLNTSPTEMVADPALAGLNDHVAGMMNDRSVSNAQIRQYVEGRGIPWDQVQGNASLAFRDTHPGHQWRASDIRLDQQAQPVSTYRRIATNFADTNVGTAAVTAGNMVTGQQIPNLVGATGGDAELARLGINELRNRNPVGAVVGDIGGAALTYGGAQAVGRVGLNAAERVAPSLFAKLPAWVRAGSSAAEAEAAAAPYSAEAASQAALAPTATLAPRAIATDAGVGAYESPGNRGEGALVGGLTGAGFRGTMNTAARAISPTGGRLAPFYEENGNPSLGQRMGGAANRMEQAFTSVPFLGDIAQRGARNAAVEQWQLGGFNRALRNLPDEPQLPAAVRNGYGQNASAAHAFAQDQFDNAYTRVHQRINVVPDDELNQQLEAIRQEATTNLGDAQLSHFNRVLDNSVLRRLRGSAAVDPEDLSALRASGVVSNDVLETLGQERSGAVSGSDLQDMLSKLRTLARNARSSPDPDARELAGPLDDVSQAIYDNAAQNSPSEAMQTLGNINRGYGMLTRIESAANRTSANPGSYSPRALMDAERRQGGLRGRQFSAGNGMLNDYAQAGMQLGDTLPSSGTAERLAAMGTAGGAVGALHFTPAAALPMAAYAADTAATLPGVRQGVNWLLRPNRPAIRPFTDEIRAQIQARAGIASTLGAPGVVSLYADQP